MKKMTAFVTIALLVCITIFVAFAANQNRYASYCFLTVDVDDVFPGPYSDEASTGTDGEGPLWSTASSWTGYYHNDNGELKFGASGYGYVACDPDNQNYRTTFSLYAKVPDNLQYPSERNPDTLPRDGFFTKSVFLDAEGNGMNFSIGGASGSASASGHNLSNDDQHNTSAASPTPVTARDLETIDDSDTDDSDTDDSDCSGPGCSQSIYADYCDDQGACTEGSGPGVPGPQCGQNYCCCP